MTDDIDTIIEKAIVFHKEPKTMSAQDFNMLYLPKAERAAMFKIY